MHLESSTVETKSFRPRHHRLLNSQSVSAFAKISLRQLQNWDEVGFISPTRLGHRRLYNAQETLSCAIAGDLKRKGFSLQKVSLLFRRISKRDLLKIEAAMNTGSALWLITDGRTVSLESLPNAVVNSLVYRTTPAAVVSVGDWIAKLAEAVKD